MLVRFRFLIDSETNNKTTFDMEDCETSRFAESGMQSTQNK